MQNIRYSPRWAGMIKRYHSTIMLREQSVAEHTWQVMLIYAQKFGSPPSHVWHYMLCHDVAEIGTGDIPFLAKRRFPALKSALQDAEKEILDDFGLSGKDLTVQEQLRVKWADLTEMNLFASEDLAMGNLYAQDIIFNIGQALALLGNVE